MPKHQHSGLWLNSFAWGQASWKTECSHVLQNSSLSTTHARSSSVAGFFCDLQYKNVVKLSEVKLTKCGDILQFCLSDLSMLSLQKVQVFLSLFWFLQKFRLISIWSSNLWVSTCLSVSPLLGAAVCPVILLVSQILRRLANFSVCSDFDFLLGRSEC